MTKIDRDSIISWSSFVLVVITLLYYFYYIKHNTDTPEKQVKVKYSLLAICFIFMVISTIYSKYNSNSTIFDLLNYI